MDIDFLLQDTYALTRPQWKIAANLDEAGRLFSEAVALNYKTEESDRAIEPEDAEEERSGWDDVDGDELPAPELDEQPSSSDDVDTEVRIPRVTGVA